MEKQRTQLVQNHKDGCPWKTRQCDGALLISRPSVYPQLRHLTYFEDSIYHIPLQAPLTTIREIKARAILLDSVMQGVAIKHPLVSHYCYTLSYSV